MNYEESYAFWKKTSEYGSVLGLENIRNLMDKLGNVQDQIPMVHIGGTNGKGSVGAFLSSALMEAGYKVGRFNSPGVFSYEEQFQINGIAITRERWAQLISKIALYCDELVAEGKNHPTSFEVDTAAAFLWFYEEQCDIALVEVGLGGALDATNVIHHPLASVFVPITMDHVRFLGNTPSQIASVKAGIIKENCPAVLPKQEKEVVDVLVERCMELNAPRHFYSISDKEQVEISDWELGLKGSYQRINAACAYTTLRILQSSFPKLTIEKIQTGFADAKWPGRFEQIASGPDIYLDGAHNEDAVKKLRQTVDEYLPGKRVIYIMGVLADKDYSTMISIMFREKDLVYAVTPPNPRALPAAELAEQLQAHKIQAISCDSVREAVMQAKEAAKSDDVILIFGSLYYLKEARSAVIEEE